MHNVRISINDQYELYDLNAKRLEIILDFLGLTPVHEWKHTSERESPLMVYYAKTLEREYSSPLTPIELKLLLKSVELGELTSAFDSILQHDTEVDGRLFARLCDADVWVKVKNFVFTTWDKVPSAVVAKHYGINEMDLTKFSINKMNTYFLNAPAEKLEQLRQIERSMFEHRRELMAGQK